MKYFYDTEFLEDGKTIDLISIGIVAEDGGEFYAVSSEFDTERVANNKWLMDNVMTSIKHRSFLSGKSEYQNLVLDLIILDPVAMPRADIAQGIVDFIGTDNHAELWAWYCAYDHIALCQLFGRMLDLPDNIPMFTNDLKTLVRLAGNVRCPEQPAGNHNALEDAKWNVVRYNYLMELLTK